MGHYTHLARRLNELAEVQHAIPPRGGRDAPINVTYLAGVGPLGGSLLHGSRAIHAAAALVVERPDKLPVRERREDVNVFPEPRDGCVE